MSLYNMLFGENPLATIVLYSLGLTRDKVPRYRDAFLVKMEGDVIICIHTRTGGGNREYYGSEELGKFRYKDYDYEGPWNEDLRKVEGYIRDEDDLGDNTYANFFFKIPEPFKDMFGFLIDPNLKQPAERWKELISQLQSGDKNAATERALEVGKKIMEKLNDPKSDGVVEV